MTTLDDVTNTILAGVLQSTTLDRPLLLTYRQVWTKRDRNGDLDYEYYCTWSDGSEGMCVSLPWDRMGDAVELPMDAVSPC